MLQFRVHSVCVCECVCVDSAICMHVLVCALVQIEYKWRYGGAIYAVFVYHCSLIFMLNRHSCVWIVLSVRVHTYIFNRTWMLMFFYFVSLICLMFCLRSVCMVMFLNAIYFRILF